MLHACIHLFYFFIFLVFVFIGLTRVALFCVHVLDSTLGRDRLSAAPDKSHISKLNITPGRELKAEKKS